MTGDNNIALYAFRTFGDTVLRAAYSCCGNYAEAEDITQDVFLTLHTKPQIFNTDEHLKAWLLRVTINKCRNLKKSFRISHTRFFEESEEEHISEEESSDTSDVRQAVEALPQKYRCVIYLYYYEGYNTREIGELLGKSENTVSSLLNRGRKKLRLELEKEEQYEN